MSALVRSASPSPMPNPSQSFSTAEELLITESILHLLQQQQQQQQQAAAASLSLTDIDWQSVSSLLQSKQLTSPALSNPAALAMQVQSLLASFSPSSSSAAPVSVASLLALSSALKQRRLQQLKEELSASSTRQQQLEEALHAVAPASGSLKLEASNLPPPSSLSALSSPLMMSPLQRSVQQRSTLPSTPLPSTAASMASIPAEGASTSPPPPAESSAAAHSELLPGGRWKRDEAAAVLAATPPPPLRRTITDMELEPSSAADDVGAALPRTAEEAEEVIPASPRPTASPTPLDTGAASSSATSTAASTTSSSPSGTSAGHGRSPSPSSVRRTLLEILALLQQHPDAEPFLVPVSAEEAPGYYDTIKEPMDFSTIQAAVQSGALSAPVEFHRRLLLVFSNAYAYNDRKTTFYKMAKNLDNFAAELCRKYFPDEERSFRPNAEARKGSGRVSKGGVGLREVVQDTPVGPIVVAVVSAPTSPRGEGEDGAGEGAAGEESEGRKGGRASAGRGSMSAVSTPSSAAAGGSAEKMSTRTKGTKAGRGSVKAAEEDEEAQAQDAEVRGAASRKKAAAPPATTGRAVRGRKGTDEPMTEEANADLPRELKDTPRASGSRKTARGRGK